MDFIERWLGISPDGGSGALEFLVVAGLAATALALVYRWRMWAAVRHWIVPGGDAKLARLKSD